MSDVPYAHIKLMLKGLKSSDQEDLYTCMYMQYMKLRVVNFDVHIICDRHIDISAPKYICTYMYTNYHLLSSPSHLPRCARRALLRLQGVFRPSRGPKSTPTSSIMQTNVIKQAFSSVDHCPNYDVIGGQDVKQSQVSSQMHRFLRQFCSNIWQFDILRFPLYQFVWVAMTTSSNQCLQLHHTGKRYPRQYRTGVLSKLKSDQLRSTSGFQGVFSQGFFRVARGLWG